MHHITCYYYVSTLRNAVRMMKLLPFASDPDSQRSFRTSQLLRLGRVTISIQRNARLCHLISLHLT